MITEAALNGKPMKDLSKLASRHGVANWQSLKKEQLVKAILRASQPKAKSPGKPTSRAEKPVAKGGASKSAASKPAASKPPAAKSAPTKTAASKGPAKPASHSIKAQPKGGVKGAAGSKSSPKPADAKGAAPKPQAKGARIEDTRSELSKNGHRPAAKPSKPPAKPSAKSIRVQQKIQSAKAERDRHKDLATATPAAAEVEQGVLIKATSRETSDAGDSPKAQVVKKDRVVLLVRDAYWLQSVWELTRQSVERAQVALAQQWHTARPVLRLIELESNATTSSVEQVTKLIPIHGGVNTWFIDVQDSPKTYRVDVGYMAASGKFFALARSNTVTTPRPGTRDGLENNWSDIANDCEKIYALSGGFSDEAPNGELQEVFEERLGRPMGGPAGSRYGVGADKVFNRRNEFQFEVDAEMIIFGRTRANARVTLAGNPIKLRADGSFAARLAMPDRRQVLPIVASSADGIEQHTVVIAVERNTKVMEPMVREAND